MYKCKKFNIKELVSKQVYNYYTKSGYGENFIWSFFDEEILQDLDYIRKTWNKSIIINNWSYGGNLHQCGLRSNVEPIVKSKKTPYLSGHCLAKAFDLHDKQGNNRGLFLHIKKLIEENKLKKMHRLENFEKTPTWVHIDGLRTEQNKIKVF